MSLSGIDTYFDELGFLSDLHLVGGAVRDWLMNGQIHDLDFATRDKPETILHGCIDRDIPVYATGLDHGTVTAIVNGQRVEITTFRKDVSTDGRRATVEWAERIEDDLSRRDFTINAIAMDRDGNLVDPFGGKHDLKRGVIRAVGNPEDRFREDYLRIVRAARFMSMFPIYRVEESTSDAMDDLGCQVLDNVAVERVVDEIDKAFKTDYPGNFLNELFDIDILDKLIPEFEGIDTLTQNPEYHPEGDVLSHVLEVVDRAPYSHRWHALLHDIGKRDTAEWDKRGFYTFYGHDKVGADLIPRIAQDLCLSNALRDSIYMTTKWHMMPCYYEDTKITKKKIRRFQANVGAYLKDVEIVCRADDNGRRDPKVWKLFDPLSEPIEPVLKGRHLIEAGYEPGPRFGEMLQRAHDYQIETGCQDINELLNVATNNN